MSDLQGVIDDYAEGIDYRGQSAKFLNLERWTGDDPLLLLADAAGTTTGQNYFEHVKPSAEAFQARFLDNGRVGSFRELSTIAKDDPDLMQVFEAQRKRHVLLEGAGVFASVEAADDLARLQQWASSADPHAYSEDPFGRINGVGLRTFQYLRMVAGTDTVKPDIQVKRFVEAIADATDYAILDATSDHAVLRSCEWMAAETDYRMIDLDQIAWWHFSDADQCHAGDAVER